MADKREKNLRAAADAAARAGNARGAAEAERAANTEHALRGDGSAPPSYAHAGSLRDPVDRSALIRAGMDTAAPRGFVGANTVLREEKSATDETLRPFAGDAVSQAGAAYAAEGFRYADPNGYAARMNDLNARLDAALTAYAGGTYRDYTESPAYRELAERYRRNGRLAAEDALGAASRATGGLAGSYAVTAAQQAENGWLSALEEAAQAAYQRERAGQADSLAALSRERGALASLYADDYARAYRSDRDAQSDFYSWYSLLDARRADERAAEDSRLAAERELAQADRRLDLTEAAQARDARAAESEETRRSRESALALLQMGVTLTDSELSAAGMSRAQADEYYRNYLYRLYCGIL